MYKSKAKLIAVTFIIFVIFISFMNNNFATNLYKENLNEDEITDWKVTITSDTKDLKDTQEMNFKVENNENVAKGRIAPGCKAIATIEISLVGTKVPVDIIVKVDDSNLHDAFKLTTKLDKEVYTSGTTKTLKLENNKAFTVENGKRILTLELEWENKQNNITDTALGIIGGTVKVPVTINVTQHI